MPIRTPEQEARFQELEQAKQQDAAEGSTYRAVDRYLAYPQAFTRGAAWLPRIGTSTYSALTGNADPLASERGDDSYMLSMSPGAAKAERMALWATELVGALVGPGGVARGVLAIPKTVRAAPAAVQGVRTVAPVAVEGIKKSLKALPGAISSKVKGFIPYTKAHPVKATVGTAVYGGLFPWEAYKAYVGENTESWQDYESSLGEYEENKALMREYEENKALVGAYQKRLSEYKKIIGASEAEQSQRAKTFFDDLGTVASRNRWYKQPVGASLLGAGVGATLGYGLSSFVTKDKVKRILSTLAGGGAGAVIGRIAGERAQKAADSATARSDVYAKALSAYRGMREAMAPVEAAISNTPPSVGGA